MPLDLDHLLESAVKAGGSDLLLVPGAPPTVRVHGELGPLEDEGEVMGPYEAADLLVPHLSGARSEAFRRGQATDFCFDRPNIGRFRCNLHRSQAGVSASLRVLPGAIPDFPSLNLPDQVARFTDCLRGFILVVGPSGSGKSTTLASLVDMINTCRAAHIITVEDPVEYRHAHRRGVVEQIEVGTDTPSFADALRHALRQDPDVILVGEMRDLDTIGIALTAAETGHLVFSTMHTNDTTQAVDRIVDVFPAHQQNQVRQQIALSLTGVVAQHLVPTSDGRGRVPAVEILLANDAIRNLIRTSKTFQIYSTLSTSRAMGMQTMEESLASWFRRGRITRADAVASSTRTEELEALLR